MRGASCERVLTEGMSDSDVIRASGSRIRFAREPRSPKKGRFLQTSPATDRRAAQWPLAVGEGALVERDAPVQPLGGHGVTPHNNQLIENYFDIMQA